MAKKDVPDMVFEDDDGFGDDDEDGKVYNKLDYNKVLIRQIDRVNQSLTLGKEHFVNSIECLEAIVFPMRDELYVTAMSKSELRIKEAMELFSRRSKTNSEISPFVFNFALFKYKQIMELLQRKGFFPPIQRTISM